MIGIERVSDRSERVSDQNERVRGRSERVRDQSERVSLREMFRDEKRERERGIILINRLTFFFFFFAFMNRTHLFLDVYYNSGAKFFRCSSTTGASF